MERRITPQEGWELQYRGERYLRDLSDSELFTRAGDLITVMIEHSSGEKIGLIPISEGFPKMERFTHVLEELKMRGADYRQPEIIEAMHAPKPNSSKVRRALQTLFRKNWPDPILVKYGERKYMSSLLLEGKGRISLAKTYNDVSLGRARADDESRISVYVHPIDAHRLMAVEHYPAGGSRGTDVDVPYWGSVKIDLQVDSDFYIYCMAASCNVCIAPDGVDSAVGVS